MAASLKSYPEVRTYVIYLEYFRTFVPGWGYLQARAMRKRSSVCSAQ